MVGVVPDDQHPHHRQRVGRVPLRTGVRSRARGGVRAGPGGLVATLAGIVPAVGDPADADPVADLVDLSGTAGPRSAPCTASPRKLDEQTLVPALRSVTIGTTSDVVVVRILTGQSVADGRTKRRPWPKRSAPAGDDPLHPAREISITAHHGDALATPIRLRRPTTDPW